MDHASIARPFTKKRGKDNYFWWSSINESRPFRSFYMEVTGWDRGTVLNRGSLKRPSLKKEGVS